MNRFIPRRIVQVLCMSGMVVLSNQVMASSFQLWEQDGASIGNYHAGYAAAATDASIAFYNPAGIIRFKNQQAVFAGIGVVTDFKYVGTVRVSTIGGGLTPMPTTAQGGSFSFIPALHYVAPVSERVGFGFSVAVPFGLKTDYGFNSPLRYVATTTSVEVIDVSPSLGVLITDKASIGFGFDIQRMFAEFDSVGALGVGADTNSTNKANDTAYGYHLGAMYQFNDKNRIGISYHSQVRHQLSGSSYFEGPLATLFNGGTISSRATSNITLPAYTALSGYFHPSDKIALMASVIYTQWNVIHNLTLEGLSGVSGLSGSRNIVATLNEYWHNTWNFTVGTDYMLTDRITLRGGVGYDQTPVREAYRTVHLPDNDRTVVAMGGHYQASKAIGVDLSWSHFFINTARILPPPEVFGAESVNTSGNVSGSADVYGAQITWDIA